eukprot:20921-Heterococcus_DN1.PRE.6
MKQRLQGINAAITVTSTYPSYQTRLQIAGACAAAFVFAAPVEGALFSAGAADRVFLLIVAWSDIFDVLEQTWLNQIRPQRDKLGGTEPDLADLGSLCKRCAACRRDDDRRDGGMQREEKPMDFDV